MNSGPTAERVYQALKGLIMGRHFLPGERLEPAALADLLSSSVTPVRDALHLLTGEGLVRTRTGDGFHLPALNEPRLDDLYAWTAEVLILALRNRSPRSVPREGAERDLVERTAALFSAIAARSPNAEHGAVMTSLNDRLHSVRLLELQVLGAIDSELEDMIAADIEDDRRQLARLVGAYHRRRRRHAAELVRAAYRTPPSA
ncbi:MAG TPA: GntR family transcriptional regulator [Allosphingosinicella sp.]|jgi:DNA-binding GntR family transcriptional regulator